MKALINRINQLYQKRISQGLTEEEKQEEQNLRALYLKNIRESFKGQLNQIEIVDEGETEKEQASSKPM